MKSWLPVRLTWVIKKLPVPESHSLSFSFSFFLGLCSHASVFKSSHGTLKTGTLETITLEPWIFSSSHYFNCKHLMTSGPHWEISGKTIKQTIQLLSRLFRVEYKMHITFSSNLKSKVPGWFLKMWAPAYSNARRNSACKQKESFHMLQNENKTYAQVTTFLLLVALFY